MHDSFLSAEKHLDIKTAKEDKSTKTIDQMHLEIQKAKPEQLEAVLEILQNMNTSKILQASS